MGEYLFFSLFEQTNWRINNIAKSANISNDYARAMEFGSFDGAESGKRHSVGFVRVSNIYSKLDEFILHYVTIWQSIYDTDYVWPHYVLLPVQQAIMPSPTSLVWH